MYTIFRPFYIIAFLSVVLVFGNAQDSQSIVQLHPTYSQTLDILARHIQSKIGNDTIIAVFPFSNSAGIITEAGISLTNDLQAILSTRDGITTISQDRIFTFLRNYNFSRLVTDRTTFLSHLSIQLGANILVTGTEEAATSEPTISVVITDIQSGNDISIGKITTEISPNLVEKTLLPVTVYRPSIAGTYSIAVRDIRLSGKDKTGNNLDALSLPDPFVRVFLGTQFIFESKTWQDTLTAEGCRTQKLLIPDSTALTIQLLDADVLQPQLFFQLTLSSPMILDLILEKNGSKTFGNEVAEIRIDFERR